MGQIPTVVLHLNEHSSDEALREWIDRRCEKLGEEFREITRLEISLSDDAGELTATAHVTGKGTEAATHASGAEPRPALDALLGKIERQLRKSHDKRIFGQRRDAQKDPPKRRPV